MKKQKNDILVFNIMNISYFCIEFIKNQKLQ